MPILSSAAFLILVLAQPAAVPQGSQPEAALSAAEIVAVKHRIATLRSPVDRHVANEWSNAKKVAELLCRPAALPVLKTQVAGVDRVFLGTDDPKTLSLESDRKLTGSGSARAPQGWRDFTFTCELDPGTGKAIAFESIPTPAPK